MTGGRRSEAGSSGDQLNGRRWTAGAVCAAALMLGACATRGPVAYTWRNVKIGGGGFEPAVIFSRAERGLVYLRTDMGGVYRWSARQGRWLPLEDGLAEYSYFGIESVAADPVDPKTVYVAAGMYPNRPAAILRSDDRGAHWQIFPTAFRMGGNMPGRGVGERLAIDPFDRAVLYFGSRYDGLQRSLDRGRTWSQVASFPWRGRGWRHSPGAQTGISFVVFDPAGRSGRPTPSIYVGLTLPGRPHLYRSDDAGRTWQAVPGQPTGLLPVQAGFDSRGQLYLTYSNGTGPNGITRGAVYHYNTRDGRWTDITPQRDSAVPGGYMGLAVDASDPGYLLVATVDRWHPGDILWRSTDGGRSWQDLRAVSRRDVSATPFLLWGKPTADFGWWMAGVAIDPFDPGHAVYTTGATVYATNDLEGAAKGRTLLWKPWVRGVEQTAVLALASPPQGPHLLSGLGDLSGFVHEDLDRSPAEQFLRPTFTDTDSLDFAARAPKVVVRGGTAAAQEGDRGATLAYSLDFGRSWQALRPPFPADAIAVSADGRAFMAMSPIPEISLDRGESWQLADGLPAGLRPVADRLAPRTFYALSFGRSALYVSTDGGVSFHVRAARGLPADLAADRPKRWQHQWPLMATPGRAGDLWLVSHQGLFHSEDGGRSFHEVDSDVHVVTLGFGRAAPHHRYPTLYALGWKGGLYAIWRSEDEGQSWRRINDARHQYGGSWSCLSGDPRVFGRVYVGTNGRGIVYGQPAAR